MRRSERGFTLVELLLALGISAFVAALAYAGITTAIAASTSMRADVRRLDDLQRTLGILEDDLGQLRARGITNGFGTDEPAFRGGNARDPLLEFTRGGLANPLDLPRSDLQRVRYRLADGRLWRETWPVLDRVDENAAPTAVLLLENVESAAVAFFPAVRAGGPADFHALAAGTAFSESEWEAPAVAADLAAPLPAAVSLRLTLRDFGEVLRVVELP